MESQRVGHDWASNAHRYLEVKNLPAKQETQVQSLGWIDPLEEEMASSSSILAQIIPCRAESVSVGSQRVGSDSATRPPPPPQLNSEGLIWQICVEQGLYIPVPHSSWVNLENELSVLVSVSHTIVLQEMMCFFSLLYITFSFLCQNPSNSTWAVASFPP